MADETKNSSAKVITMPNNIVSSIFKKNYCFNALYGSLYEITKLNVEVGLRSYTSKLN